MSERDASTGPALPAMPTTEQQVREAMTKASVILKRASALSSSMGFADFDIEKAVRSQMFFLEHGRLPVGDEIR